jgi:hypothetical protein
MDGGCLCQDYGLNVQDDLVKAQNLLNEPGKFDSTESRRFKNTGAKNMALVRHFAAHHPRVVKNKRSIKLRRKRAGYDHDCLATLLRSLSR